MRTLIRPGIVLLLALVTGLLWARPEQAEAAGATAVAAGENHTCALTTGGVRCWGFNATGQLGDGTAFTRNTPVDVVGLSDGVVAVAAGGGHTCALIDVMPPADDYGVKCWGWNAYGQLGDGSGTNRATPVDVVGLSGGVVAVAAGDNHTCALVDVEPLTEDYGVKCWGRNDLGQLGDEQNCGAKLCTTPVDVLGLTSGVGTVEVGNGHACAMTTMGGLKCWGRNDLGQLGDGTTINRNAPVNVSGLTSGVAAIAALEDNHTCSVTTTTSVRCWGNDEFDQLGNETSDTCVNFVSGGTVSCSTTPLAVCVSGSGLSCSLLTGAVAAATGGNHTCVLTTAGVKCWGHNNFGQLGDGQGCGTICSTPADVMGLSTGGAEVTAGANHACVLTSEDTVKCWGRNAEGQLGDGQNCGTVCTIPVPVVSIKPTPTASPTPTDTPTDTPTATPTPTPTITPTGTPPFAPKFDALFGKIDTLVDPPGLQTSLRAKLNTAKALTEGANPCASANVMGALINQVEAETPRRIPLATAALLIDQAQNIFDQLEEGNSCSPNPPDADGDQIIDSAEATLGTDPAVPDTDGDLADDGLELLHTGTDPLDPDTDSNGTPDGSEDPDQDGCTTGAEVLNTPGQGGGRDPLYFWDFMDMYVAGTRNRQVNIGDITALVQRFGAIGDPGGDPLDPPLALTGYHVSADRSSSIGPNLWNAGPPDSQINILEITQVVVQFGHTCA